MAAKETDSPSWADTFQNILKLEESRGFDNKAVIGGLDKFIIKFAGEMAAQDVSDKGFMLEESYDSMSEKLRAQWVIQWREALGGEPDPHREPSPVVATTKKRKPTNRSSENQLAKNLRLHKQPPIKLHPQKLPSRPQSTV